MGEKIKNHLILTGQYIKETEQEYLWGESHGVVETAQGQGFHADSAGSIADQLAFGGGEKESSGQLASAKNQGNVMITKTTDGRLCFNGIGQS